MSYNINLIYKYLLITYIYRIRLRKIKSVHINALYESRSVGRAATLRRATVGVAMTLTVGDPARGGCHGLNGLSRNSRAFFNRRGGGRGIGNGRSADQYARARVRNILYIIYNYYMYIYNINAVQTRRHRGSRGEN